MKHTTQFNKLIKKKDFKGLDSFVNSNDVTMDRPEFVDGVSSLASDNPEDADKLIDIYIKHGVISKKGWDSSVFSTFTPSKNWLQCGLSHTTIRKLLGYFPVMSHRGNMGLNQLYRVYNLEPTLLSSLNLSDEECTVLSTAITNTFKDGDLSGYSDYISYLMLLYPVILISMDPEWMRMSDLMDTHFPGVRDVFFF